MARPTLPLLAALGLIAALLRAAVAGNVLNDFMTDLSNARDEMVAIRQNGNRASLWLLEFTLIAVCFEVATSFTAFYFTRNRTQQNRAAAIFTALCTLCIELFVLGFASKQSAVQDQSIVSDQDKAVAAFAVIQTVMVFLLLLLVVFQATDNTIPEGADSSQASLILCVIITLTVLIQLAITGKLINDDIEGLTADIYADMNIVTVLLRKHALMAGSLAVAMVILAVVHHRKGNTTTKAGAVGGIVLAGALQMVAFGFVWKQIEVGGTGPLSKALASFVIILVVWEVLLLLVVLRSDTEQVPIQPTGRSRPWILVLFILGTCGVALLRGLLASDAESRKLSAGGVSFDTQANIGTVYLVTTTFWAAVVSIAAGLAMLYHLRVFRPEAKAMALSLSVLSTLLDLLCLGYAGKQFDLGSTVCISRTDPCNGLSDDVQSLGVFTIIGVGLQFATTGLILWGAGEPVEKTSENARPDI